MDAFSKWVLASHQKPVLRSSVWQLLNTLVPYVLLWALMILTIEVSYALTLGLAVVASGFLVRVFIIFHDCAHGSFVKTARMNRLLGTLTGVLVFTPYAQWRYQHLLHHSSSGNLDRRGTGDIWTMTVDEYLAAPFVTRLCYRIVRNPIFLFFIAPLYLFLVEYRLPSRKSTSSARRDVILTNLVLLGIVLIMWATIGIGPYLLIQIPVLMSAGVLGFWLFYIQHQFEDVYWERRKDWDFKTAAVKGSSFYKLPKVLQWFTGNIGFHHVHHLWPTIPNYNLEKCHEKIPMFRQIKPVTLWSSRKSLSSRLWDERQKKLISFGQVRRSQATRVLGG